MSSWPAEAQGAKTAPGSPVGGHTLARALPGTRWLLRLSGATALYRFHVYIGCTALALAITYVLGKDLAWDTLNYHVYAGFSVFNDRFTQDYFAAGPQSYLNPFAYAPFYALIRSGLSALQVGALLTLWHSVLLWLTFELALVVCPSADRRTRALLGVLAVALALINPVLLQQIGSSQSDVTTAEIVLGGFILLARAVRAPSVTALLGAAALLGVATALKLTNGVHAIAAAAMLLMLPLSLQGRLRHGLIYAAALAASFTIVAAPWSYRLERMFGNPFFPLFNNIFRSPEFTLEPLRLYRFIPASIAEALWRPFAMLDPSPLIHYELRAPDERYAVLAILVATLLGRRLWQQFSRSAPTVPTKPLADMRCVTALGCAFAVDWALWLVSSGNSRYFLPMACVGAVLIVALLPALLGARRTVWVSVVIVLAAMQVFQIWMNPGLRWQAVPWDGGPWIKVEVPEKLAVTPALYLTIGANSNSFLAPFVARDAGFINFTGAYALGPTGESGERLRALISRYAPHLRFLAEGDRLYTDVKHLPNLSDVDGAVGRFGLRADPGDCTTIVVLTAQSQENRPRYATSLVSCSLVPDTADRSGQIAGQRAVEVVLDRVEDACPELLQPRRPITEYRNHRWQRVYLNSDITAWVSRGWVKLYNPVSHDGPIFLGPESDWSAAPLRVACGRRDGHDFARVLSTNVH
jgi:hypothetical protein